MKIKITLDQQLLKKKCHLIILSTLYKQQIKKKKKLIKIL